MGLVDRVAWLRPAWATQLPDGKRTLRIGAFYEVALLAALAEVPELDVRYDRGLRAVRPRSDSRP